MYTRNCFEQQVSSLFMVESFQIAPTTMKKFKHARTEAGTGKFGYTFLNFDNQQGNLVPPSRFPALLPKAPSSPKISAKNPPPMMKHLAKATSGESLVCISRVDRLTTRKTKHWQGFGGFETRPRPLIRRSFQRGSGPSPIAAHTSSMALASRHADQSTAMAPSGTICLIIFTQRERVHGICCRAAETAPHNFVYTTHAARDSGDR